MGTDKNRLREYNAHRPAKARYLLCHAPFSSINFTQNGDMRACCYNRTEILGTYPRQSIAEAWEGEAAQKLRAAMKGSELGGGCEGCQEQIAAGNFSGAKSVYYDEYASLRSLLPFKPARPKVFEFEISNTCNLECVMCNGYFSSAIRANREKLPKLHSPYDDAFIDNVKTYLPSLKDAKFLGGEPFMISPYYQIWDAIIAINPAIRVHITTNGTVLNKRAKDCLEKMHAGIVISVDSLDKENYERIRVNGDFESLMENIRWFIDYRNRKGTYLTFAVCPIYSNRKHLADVVRFCNRNDIAIHFNTVWDPKEECLRYAPLTEMERLIADLSEITFTDDTTQKINRERTQDLLAQLQAWHREQGAETETVRRFLSVTDNGETETLSPDTRLILNETRAFYRALLEQTGFGNNTPKPLGARLESVCENMGHERFQTAFWKCVLFAAQNLYAPADYETIRSKTESLLVSAQGVKPETANRMMLQRNFDFMDILGFLKNMDLEEIKRLQALLLST